MNEVKQFPPPIPVAPCYVCGELTDETQSVNGIAHIACFQVTKEASNGSS